MLTKPLPPFCHPGRSRPIKGVAVHFISGKYMAPSDPWNMQLCWNILHDLNLPKEQRKFYPNVEPTGLRQYASYNELIGRNPGEDWLLVPHQRETYHAGVSMHKGQKDCNKFLLGISLVADEKSGYTDWQYERLAEICAEAMTLYGFGLEDIVGHDEIRANAIAAGLTDSSGHKPKPKPDPGSMFDWPRLRRMIDARRTATAG